MAVRKIEHIGIMVSNIEQSIAFYTSVLGLKHNYTLPLTNGDIRLAFLYFPGHEETEIELIEGIGGEFPAEGKTHHTAYTVDDIESEFERVKGLNVQIRDTEITTLPNGARFFFLFGPDGELLELFQPAGKTGN